MNSEEIQANLEAQVSSKECDYVSNPSNQIANSSMILETVSEGDIISVDNIQDIGCRNDPLRYEDATELKLDEMMDKLLEILDETITILGGEVDEEGDSGYYTLSDPSDQNGKNEDRNVHDEAFLEDATIIKQNFPNNDADDRQSEAEAEDFIITKNLKGKCNGLNEFTESLMIALMLFSLYFLLSSLI